jgi:hypothetical protein
MPAGIYNIIIEPGSTFSRTLTWRNADGNLVDLTNYTATLVIADSYGGTALLTLTEGSGITLGGALGTIGIVMTVTQTNTLEAGERYWDLVLVDSSAVATRLVKGTALVDPKVAA